MVQVQLHFLPVRTQHQKGRALRDVELAAQKAKSHAASISHRRAGRGNPESRGLKGRSKCASRDTSQSPQDLALHERVPIVPLTLEEEESNERTQKLQALFQTLSLTLFEGNCDPFRCFDLQITAELNNLITFTRDVGVPAHFKPLAIRAMEVRNPKTNVQYLGRNSIDRFCGDIYQSFADEGTALARLISYNHAMSKCIPHSHQSQILTLKMRSRSTMLLREKLSRYTESASPEEKLSLRQHMFGLFDADAFDGNIDAARLHAVALRKILPAHAVDISMMNRIFYINVSVAALSGMRTLVEVDEWCLAPMQRFLEDFAPLIIGNPKSRDIHESIVAPQLAEIFQRRSQALDATVLRDDAGVTVPHPYAYTYTAIATNVDFCLLINMYHDLVDGEVMTESTDCERMTQAALVVALTYLHRRLYGDFTIAGKDRRDVSHVLKSHLKRALSEAYRTSDELEKVVFREPWLWALYVGALCEHHGRLGFVESKHEPMGFFSCWLAQHARSTGVTSWKGMRKIAERFWYVKIIEPDGGEWFEDLLRCAMR